MDTTLAGAGCVLALILAGSAVSAAPPPRPSALQAEQGETPSASGAHAEASDDAHGAETHAPDAASGEAHGESVWVTLSRVANFAILAGLLYWLLRAPIATHLANRGSQIRKDLVAAAAVRKEATARLADIEQKLQTLPAEIALLQQRGTEELEAERGRIRQVAEIERDRLIAQTRREIAMQTRTARHHLRDHAAALTVAVAEERLRTMLTPTDHEALVVRYAAQMRSVQ